MKVMQVAPSFNDFMRGSHTPEDKILVQAIAVITVQERFHHMTPEDVYDMLVDQATQIEAMDD
jgi:hypothetical protein